MSTGIATQLSAAELACDALRLASNTLLVNLRFLDMALYRFELIEDSHIGIGTDGDSVRFTADCVLDRFRKSSEVLTHDYLHMIIHCLLHHPFVSLGINRTYWDLACDIAAESIVDELSLRCISREGAAQRQTVTSELKASVGSLTAERLYRHFCDIELSEGDAVRMNEPFCRDDHELWWYSRIEADSSYCDDEKDDGKSGEAMPAAGSKQPRYKRVVCEQQWQDISEHTLTDLETLSRVWGDRTVTLKRTLNGFMREKYDYAEFLRGFAVFGENVQINHDEFDTVFYTYGLQLYENMPLVEPLEYKEIKRIRDFVIAIDTSGSVQGELIRRFITKTYNILSQSDNFFERVNLHIIQCNTAVRDDTAITCRDDFDSYMSSLEISGSGGTDFRPVFEHVEALIEAGSVTNLKGLIYFTDGLGSFPEKMPPYKTAFVFVGGENADVTVPIWAIKLVLEADEL